MRGNIKNIAKKWLSKSIQAHCRCYQGLSLLPSYFCGSHSIVCQVPLSSGVRRCVLHHFRSGYCYFNTRNSGHSWQRTGVLCLDLITSGSFTPDPILFDSTNRKMKIIRGEVKSQSTNNESTQFSSKTDTQSDGIFMDFMFQVL